MRKDVSVDVAGRVLRDTKEAGILVLLFLIAEFPGETLADTRATIDFLEKNAASIDAVHISEYKLIKNSAMYEEAEKFGISVESTDEFGIPIWAITKHTVRNRMLLKQMERRLWGRPQVPWPLVGGM
jgi:radical SAM superfamily enzyme